jgi:hypothetical protein
MPRRTLAVARTGDYSNERVVVAAEPLGETHVPPIVGALGPSVHHGAVALDGHPPHGVGPRTVNAEDGTQDVTIVAVNVSKDHPVVRVTAAVAGAHLRIVASLRREHRRRAFLLRV